MTIGLTKLIKFVNKWLVDQHFDGSNQIYDDFCDLWENEEGIVPELNIEEKDLKQPAVGYLNSSILPDHTRNNTLPVIKQFSNQGIYYPLYYT